MRADPHRRRRLRHPAAAQLADVRRHHDAPPGDVRVAARVVLVRVEDNRGSVRDLEGERERLDVVGEHHVRPHVVEKRHGVPHEPVPEVGPLAGARDDARQAGRLVEPRRHRRSGRRQVDVARAVVTRRAPHACDRDPVPFRERPRSAGRRAGHARGGKTRIRTCAIAHRIYLTSDARLAAALPLSWRLGLAPPAPARRFAPGGDPRW